MKLSLYFLPISIFFCLNMDAKSRNLSILWSCDYILLQMCKILKGWVGKELVFPASPHYAFHIGVASALASLVAMLFVPFNHFLFQQPLKSLF